MSALRELCGMKIAALTKLVSGLVPSYRQKLAYEPLFVGVSLSGGLNSIGQKVLDAAGDVGTAIGNRTRRWANPFAYKAVREADALDKKIDKYNQRQWAKNPDPTSDAPVYVNRGSTFSRNGHPLRLNLKGLPDVSHATAIDAIDAWHRDPETTHLPPPSISRAPSVIFKNNSMGVPNPLGRGNVGHVWLQPWADTSSLVHEVGHNRSYGTRSSGRVWSDGLKYTLQRPGATMLMEDLAEDNGWRLNSFMNPETRMKPEAWARHSDETLGSYTRSHDPKKKYVKSLTHPSGIRQYTDRIKALSRPDAMDLPSQIDGRDRYTPQQYNDLPGQPNWPRSEFWQQRRHQLLPELLVPPAD